MIKYIGMYAYKSLAMVSIIVCVGVISVITTCILQKQKDVIIEKAVVTDTDDNDYKKYFKEQWGIAKQIALKESGENDKAIGFNCKYNKHGDVYDFTGVSASKRYRMKPSGYRTKVCKVEDRKNAWSHDITKFQINLPIDAEIISDEQGTAIAFYIWQTTGRSFSRWTTCSYIPGCK